HRTGDLIVGQGRMANVGGEQHLLLRLARQYQLTISQGAWSKGGANDRAVRSWLEILPDIVADAEAPVPLVVGGDVGDGIGQIGLGVQVRLQFVQRKLQIHRLRVADDVQVVPGKVGNDGAVRADEACLGDVPFL